MTPPNLDFAFELHAQLARPFDIGPTPLGLRRIIDITSGTFTGPLLHGTLLPNGADWQIIRSDAVTELHAHYILSTHDGTLIQVNVRGLRHAPPGVLDRIAEGERVPESAYYFRVAPIFQAPAGPYDWLNQSIFIGSGVRESRSVRIQIFRVL